MLWALIFPVEGKVTAGAKQISRKMVLLHRHMLYQRDNIARQWVKNWLINNYYKRLTCKYKIDFGLKIKYE